MKGRERGRDDDRYIFGITGYSVERERREGMCVMDLARESFGVKELKVERDISSWDL